MIVEHRVGGHLILCQCRLDPQQHIFKGAGIGIARGARVNVAGEEVDIFPIEQIQELGQLGGIAAGSVGVIRGLDGNLIIAPVEGDGNIGGGNIARIVARAAVAEQSAAAFKAGVIQLVHRLGKGPGQIVQGHPIIRNTPLRGGIRIQSGVSGGICGAQRVCQRTAGKHPGDACPSYLEVVPISRISCHSNLAGGGCTIQKGWSTPADCNRIGRTRRNSDRQIGL